MEAVPRAAVRHFGAAGPPRMRAPEAALAAAAPVPVRSSVHRSIPCLLAASLLVSACSRTEPPAPAAAAPGAGSTKAAPPAAAAANQGKVVQTQQGGGYTYAEVETASGRKVWIAGSQIDVKPGTAVEWGDHAVMRNFTSPSIGRSFDEILFVNRWGPVGGASVATPVHGVLPPPPEPGKGGVADKGTVKSVVDSGGYSYIEVDRGGRTVWVAAAGASVKAGDKIQWHSDTEMSNFKAASLGRTFDRLVFASSVSVTR